ncbi:MAG: twin transmembrane helix small protein [Pseudomonadota bacterium]
MSGFLYFLIPVGLLATLVILGVGIYSLAKGGAFAKENSNRLMRLRVAAQGITIALMFLFLFLIGKGPSG